MVNLPNPLPPHCLPGADMYLPLKPQPAYVAIIVDFSPRREVPTSAGLLGTLGHFHPRTFNQSALCPLALDPREPWARNLAVGRILAFSTCEELSQYGRLCL